MTATAGMLGKAGIGANATVDQRIDFQSESIVANEEIHDGNGIRGTRSHSVDRFRKGNIRVGGTLSMQPNPTEWSYILPWSLGANGTGGPNTSYGLGETITGKFLVVDRIIKVHTYSVVKPDTLTIRTGQGEPVSAQLSLVGENATAPAAAGSFPAININATYGPFMFYDSASAIDVAGTTISPSSLEVTVNNHIDKERFLNSRTLTGGVAQDRDVTVRLSIPYGDYSAILGTGANTGGVPFNATFTQGNASLKIACPAIVFPLQDPSIQGRRELYLDIEGHAFKSGASDEITITLNTTP